ncbi:oligosaccharide flippase family protein [Salipiger mucosus]|uniref:oligosaccharide flippase family protein n=1 Tax=Salipiger mucosus TaxID=263378 RepID=UPI0018DBCACA|nr:oligosaccharide flippase family protein [Salipiger mucosus]
MGVAASQAVNILSYPILSRVFTPEQFGAFSIFFFGMQILGASLSARFEQGIMLCTTQRRARSVLLLAQATALIASLALVIAAIALQTTLDEISGVDLGLFWALLPVSGFFVSCQTSLTYMAIRLGAYRNVSVAKVVKSFSAFVIQIILAYFVLGGIGALIYGETLGAVLSILPLLRCSNKSLYRTAFRKGSRRQYLFRLAGVYRDQPIWNLPHVLMSQIVRWLTAIMIARMYTTSEAGAYFMMFRVVMMPSTLVSRSLSQIFFRSAAEEQRDTGRFERSIVLIGLPVLTLGAVMALVLNVYGPTLFTFALGPSWIVAGEMAAVFAPYVVLQMTLATIAPSYLLGKKQKVMLVVALFQSAVFLGGFLLGRQLGDDIFWAIRTSVWLSVPYMLCMLIWYYRMAIEKREGCKDDSIG